MCVFLSIVMIMLSICFSSKAALTKEPRTMQSVDENTLKSFLQQETSIDPNSVNIGEVLAAYEELTKKYTNEEIADMVEEHKEEVKSYGISEDVLLAGTKLLRTVDEKELNKILKEDLKVDQIKEKLEAGVSTDEIVEELQKNLSTTDKLTIGVKVLLTSSIFRTAMIVIIVLFIYGTILKWVLFHKAGRHGWAAIIPIYREVTLLKVCDMSAWWLLFLVIPVVGWLVLGVVAIVTRFRLAKAFGKGIGFGFGLLLLGVIFESILAFSPHTKYVGIEQ